MPNVTVTIGGTVPVTLGPAMNFHFDIAKRDFLLLSDTGVDEVEHDLGRDSMFAPQDTGGLLGEAEYGQVLSMKVKRWHDDLADVSLVTTSGTVSVEGAPKRELTADEIAKAFVTCQDKGHAGSWITCIRADVTGYEHRAVDNWVLDGRLCYAVSFFSEQPLYDRDQIFYMKVVPIVSAGGGTQPDDTAAHLIVADYKGHLTYYIGGQTYAVVPCDPISYGDEHRIEMYRQSGALVLKSDFCDPVTITTPTVWPFSSPQQNEPYCTVVTGFKRGGISGLKVEQAEFPTSVTVDTAWMPYPADYSYPPQGVEPRIRAWDSIVEPIHGPPGTAMVVWMRTHVEGRNRRHSLRLVMTGDGRASPTLLGAYAKFRHSGKPASVPTEDLTPLVQRIEYSERIDDPRSRLLIDIVDIYGDHRWDHPSFIIERPITVTFWGRTLFTGVVKEARYTSRSRAVRTYQLVCASRWTYLEQPIIGSMWLNGMTVREAMLAVLGDAGWNMTQVRFVPSGPGDDDEYATYIPEAFSKGTVKTKSGMLFSEALQQINELWTPRNLLYVDREGVFVARYRPGLSPLNRARDINHSAVSLVLFMGDPGVEYDPEWSCPPDYPYYVRFPLDATTDAEQFYNEFWVIGRDMHNYRPVIARYIDYASLRDPDYLFFTGYRRWYAVYNTAITSLQAATYAASEMAGLLNAHKHEITCESQWAPHVHVGDLVGVQVPTIKETWPARLVGIDLVISRQGHYDYATGLLWPERCSYALEADTQLITTWRRRTPKEWA